MILKEVNITEDNVLTGVCRLTANAAVQRGDAQHVATVDEIDMLKQFISEGKGLIKKALGRYSTEELGYSMPKEWPDRSEEITKLAEVFLTNYTIAKWYELNGTGDRFLNVANEALEEIGILLGKRNKPTR
jgi:hypothetical protein